MRKVFLENLPRKRKGKFIDWKNCVGYIIHFIYDDVEGDMEIIDYITNTYSYVSIKYLNEVYNIRTDSLKICNLGTILKRYTSDFKIKIGQTFKNDKRDLTIIDREKRARYKKDENFKSNTKWYKYHCNKCGAELWMEEGNLLKGCMCLYCSKHNHSINIHNHSINMVVEGLNDIYTTDKWMSEYFVDKNVAKQYSHCSYKTVLMKCPYCGYEKEMRISTLYCYGFSCNKCAIRSSYPERIMTNFLKVLNVDYIKEYRKSDCDWINKGYRYDFYFYLNGEEYIIETHGKQHYEDGFKGCGGKTLEEAQQNDKNKYELAIKNGIKPQNYIVIDCRYSKLDYIKNNIINSKLGDIFDLNNVDWVNIDKQSQKNLIKEVCDYWHLHNDINNEELTVKELSNIFGISIQRIRNYLNKGNNFNWCHYDGKKESSKSSNSNRKSIEIFKDGESLGVFSSGSELERMSEKLFGVKLLNTNISKVLKGKRKHCGGFTFKRI